MNKKFTIGVLVSNKAGVLQRISSLFGRRGFNIDSLSVGETENADLSRLTVCAFGDEYVEDQIIKQLSKLTDVKSVAILDSSNSIYRELLLIKIQSKDENRAAINEAVSVYRGKIVDLASDSLTIELTGDTAKIGAFIEYVRPFGICELSRTGVSGISRGNGTILAEGIVEEFSA